MADESPVLEEEDVLDLLEGDYEPEVIEDDLTGEDLSETIDFEELEKEMQAQAEERDLLLDQISHICVDFVLGYITAEERRQKLDPLYEKLYG